MVAAKNWRRFRTTESFRIKLEGLLNALVENRVEPNLPPDALVDRLSIAVQRSEVERAELREQLSSLRAAFLRLPQATVIVDTDSLRTERSLTAQALMHGGSSALVEEQVVFSLAQQARAAGLRVEATHDALGPPPTRFHLEAVPCEDLVSHVVVTVTDIGGVFRDEAARRDLLTNLSHELRTPIGAVALLAETIADEHDPEVIRSLASRIELEAQRLSGTLLDVLSMSKLENADTSERNNVNFELIVRECVAKSQTSAELFGVRINVETPSAPVYVVGDRALLSTAISNLIENAIKYSDKHLPIEVALKVGETGLAEIVVRDHGIGIPIRDRQRIFERFYRVDRARQRDTGGTGLGLAIVRQIVVSHDGTIDVDSIEGEGATFTVRLPLTHAGEK